MDIQNLGIKRKSGILLPVSSLPSAFGIGSFGKEAYSFIDFLKETEVWDGDILTNPPYKYAKEFIEHAMELIPNGRKVLMFLKLQFLEGKSRAELFKKYPPKVVYVSRSRILCAKNGDFDAMRAAGGSAVAYAWYEFEKGYSGESIIKWIN